MTIYWVLPRFQEDFNALKHVLFEYCMNKLVCDMAHNSVCIKFLIIKNYSTMFGCATCRKETALKTGSHLV
jgi:hypothetical protein